MRKDRGVRRTPASEDIPVREVDRQSGLAARRHGDLGEVAFLHKATELGLMVAQPYGTMHAFDFIVQGGQNIYRVQVKAAAHLRKGLYAVNVCRSQGGKLRPYLASEVDFIAVYIIFGKNLVHCAGTRGGGPSDADVSSEGVRRPRPLRPLPRGLALAQ